MLVSLTAFRSRMFKLLPNLRIGEELVIAHNGVEAYVVKRRQHNRALAFEEALSKCPPLTLSDAQVEAFKTEGRR